MARAFKSFGATSIPDGWRLVRLGDVAEIDTGGTPSRSQPAYWGGAVPWMASGEINQRRVRATAEHLTVEGLNSSNAKVFLPGTVMVAMNGQGGLQSLKASAADALLTGRVRIAGGG